jgi:hypothetical protein
MSKIDMWYEFNPTCIDIKCVGCGKFDEIVDDEEWTELDSKTKLCEACFRELILEESLNCRYCSSHCSMCVL